jgi:hypothetical protein
MAPSDRSNPRQTVAWPFPHDEVTVRPKMTMCLLAFGTLAQRAKSGAGKGDGFRLLLAQRLLKRKSPNANERGGNS